MFSLMFKMMKLVAALFASLVLLVLALNFQLAYLGDGRFEVRAKSSWRLADTFAWKPDERGAAISAAASATVPPVAAASATVPPVAATSMTAPASAVAIPRSLAECAVARSTLEKAVARWNARHGDENVMAELDLFGLIEAECLEAMPSCPGGGDFQLFYAGGAPRVRCTVHGLRR